MGGYPPIKLTVRSEGTTFSVAPPTPPPPEHAVLRRERVCLQTFPHADDWMRRE